MWNRPPDPQSAVCQLYEMVASPTASAIEQCIEHESLERLRNYQLRSASGRELHGSAEDVRRFYIEQGHSGGPEEYQRLSGAELLVQLIAKYPPHIRRWKPNILGTILESPVQAWVYFRLDDADSMSYEQLVQEVEAADASGQVVDEHTRELLSTPQSPFNPQPPEWLEVRWIDGRWQVALTEVHDHPIPGLRGTILWVPE